MRSRFVEQSSVVTRKGQVTIPAEVSNRLGIRQGDRMIFSVNDKEIRLIPAGSIAEQTAGIFKAFTIGKPALTAEQLKAAAEEAIAEEADLRGRA